MHSIKDTHYCTRQKKKNKKKNPQLTCILFPEEFSDHTGKTVIALSYHNTWPVFLFSMKLSCCHALKPAAYMRLLHRFVCFLRTKHMA